MRSLTWWKLGTPGAAAPHAQNGTARTSTAIPRIKQVYHSRHGAVHRDAWFWSIGRGSSGPDSASEAPALRTRGIGLSLTKKSALDSVVQSMPSAPDRRSKSLARLTQSPLSP